MQLAQIVHGVVAMLFVAAMLAHIYIGTIGMEGAVEAMWDGTVDVNWAKEHHSLWLEQEAAKGRIAARRRKARCSRPNSAAAFQVDRHERPAGCRARAFRFDATACLEERPMRGGQGGRIGAFSAIIPPCALSDLQAGAARARPRCSPR